MVGLQNSYKKPCTSQVILLAHGTAFLISRKCTYLRFFQTHPHNDTSIMPVRCYGLLVYDNGCMIYTLPSYKSCLPIIVDLFFYVKTLFLTLSLISTLFFLSLHPFPYCAPIFSILSNSLNQLFKCLIIHKIIFFRINYYTCHHNRRNFMEIVVGNLLYP